MKEYIILACLGGGGVGALIGYLWATFLSKAKGLGDISGLKLYEENQNLIDNDSGDPNDPRSDRHWDKNNTSR